MTYGHDHVELYDLVFRSRGKDFGAEAEELAALIRDRKPGAATLLDVACGTGAHLERLAGLFDEVEGVEIAPAMREFAQLRLPDIDIHPGDMRDFDLGKKYDSLICIGNAVACMLSSHDLDKAVARMAEHLDHGGVLVVEPWWFPENFIDGYVGGHVVREDRRVVSRLTRSVREGLTTRMEIRFTVSEPEGMRAWTDELVTSLFTREEYELAFERAGCTVEFLSDPLQLSDGRANAPGLFVGVRK
ncbi:Methyltransferase domain-containing protein [Amycolatopsis lurida]|uniref:SAM-dependent methyltransferase n=1 Tax=Amycolatopsis lurida NRRL 2430 TaxID=1460371 RepID=A0A2P2FF89_AMYLU|nr:MULTISPECIES: class I SAM-dependent methyltransferase [Amycolatopsis]KFU75369.1 SAM-dependent methyltransferase [Amycolatopsis lurida NRRL 2430]QXV62678.1 class I SAM-dependent methyltransferase [Amycolatopsis sp. TNS106]RSN18181.1 class I SAM-dependent methyltransferase [Streptomyces sp. WAC 05977]SEE45566.1 Methyltransferase domain-containing protein [Amycolatopsis lurida]